MTGGYSDAACETVRFPNRFYCETFWQGLCWEWTIIIRFSCSPRWSFKNTFNISRYLAIPLHVSRYCNTVTKSLQNQERTLTQVNFCLYLHYQEHPHVCLLKRPYQTDETEKYFSCESHSKPLKLQYCPGIARQHSSLGSRRVIVSSRQQLFSSHMPVPLGKYWAENPAWGYSQMRPKPGSLHMQKNSLDFHQYHLWSDCIFAFQNHFCSRKVHGSTYSDIQMTVCYFYELTLVSQLPRWEWWILLISKIQYDLQNWNLFLFGLLFKNPQKSHAHKLCSEEAKLLKSWEILG